MNISSIETISFKPSVGNSYGPPVFTWVRVHTDDGLIGLGETYSLGLGEAAIIHDWAPKLLHKDPRTIEAHWRDLYLQIQYVTTGGADTRALSAIDIALWDLLGKWTGQPLYQLLGGKTRASVPIYNTCYDSRYDFDEEPQLLAEDLVRNGTRALKVWPFDRFAVKSYGSRIASEDLERGLRVLRAIRSVPGPPIDIALELHGLWKLPAAIQIARAVEELNLMWIEEALSQDEIPGYRELAKVSRTPIIVSERLQTKYQFRDLLEMNVAKIIMFDIDWCGGLTEARKIAGMADAYGLPVAPHNCGGPVLNAVNAHLCTAIPNLFLCETVRLWWEFFEGITDGNPLIERGMMVPQELAGHGISLKPEFLERPDVLRRESK